MDTRKLPLRGLAVLAACVFFVCPALADSVKTSASDGYARLLFSFDSATHPKASIESGVLTISFDRPVSIAPASVAQGLNDYISSARADADGKTLRFALAEDVRLHVSGSANRFAVDLVPQSFAGNPPDLPPPPPAQKPAVDVAKLAPLDIRAGAYPSFTRLVFDWGKNIPYTVFPGAGRITIRFEAQARPDFGSLTRVAPPWVKEADWRVENDGLTIDFSTDAASGYHDFRDGTHVVLDILAPKTDAQAYHPPGGNKVSATSLPQGKPDVAKAAAQAQAIADAAAKLNTNQTDATKPPAPLTPPAKDDAPKPAAYAAPAAQAPLATPGSKQADAARTKDGATLTFPGAADHGVAAFIRGTTAWIVLDGTPTIDPTHLKTALGDLPASVDVSSGDGYAVLRIGLNRDEEIAARGEGADLKVTLAPHIATAPTEISFVRNSDDPAHAALTTLLPGAIHALKLSDPDAGDTLTVVPVSLGRASLETRSYMEFAVLPTASGLVLTPFTDDLSVSVNDARVTIARTGGLSLTPPSIAAAGTPAALARGSDGPSFIDFAGWSKPVGGSFLVAERQLRVNAARLTSDEAGPARLALAKFYIANEFAAEALGYVNLMQASNPGLAGDAQLQTIRAAADYMMGRYHDAHNDLAGSSFDNDRHAAFWRGLTEAALENWGDAAKYLSQAGSVFHRYPPQWRARARIAQARAAISTGALEMADAALAHLPDNLPKPLMLEGELARARLYAQEGRYHDASKLFDAVKNSGDEREASRAIYDNVSAGLAAGAITPDAAIDALEKLRYRWRGDALELKTLRKLGSLYFAKARWREGLQALRIATVNFPNDDMALDAQDDMRKAFTDLYLKGAADKIPPIEALSLFYDFIDLTPIGPDGDEMIRRMADRLVAVDLLEPAASLLKYQVTKRLDGVARAQVATRLAMIDLMDHKAEDALDALRSTQVSTLPDDVAHQRLLLQARALAALKQYDSALDLIAVDEAPDTRSLRADIYWESGNWAVAGQKEEELLGDSWKDGKPLTDEDRRGVMRAAISYSLAGDQPSLDRLHDHYAAKMQASADASAFAVVTQKIDEQGTAFRDMAGKIASVDTLENFMKDFKSHYDTVAAVN
jgi:tetratricopeptide (TPR) repeat protein